MLHKRLLNQGKGTILLETSNEEEIMWEFRQTLVCEDMTSCTDLACRHVVDEIAAFCHCSA